MAKTILIVLILAGALALVVGMRTRFRGALGGRCWQHGRCQQRRRSAVGDQF
jgi:hypothetical protein